MKFQDFEYQRVDIAQTKQTILPMIEAFLDASLPEQIKIINRLNSLMDEINSMFTLAEIRHSLDVKDTFYQQEKHFCDQNAPLLTELKHQFSQTMVKSKHYDALVQEFGPLLFDKIKLFLKTFDPKIIPYLQEENTLTTKYQKLISDPSVAFEGKLYNLSQMATFLESSQRQTRKNAQLAVSQFFAKNEQEYDLIYDQLVQTRTKMAQILGYSNFVALGYDLLGRTDYDANQIADYRTNILKYVLPFYTMTQKRKSKRLDIAKLESYDKSFNFSSGNPKPQRGVDFQLTQAKKMYHAMSLQTKLFFDFLLEKNLLDLDSKPNKTGGGYCTYLPKYSAPFVFANFNGTSHDVDVLTHEIGHAFQVYQSRHLIPEYRWPTFEAAEISSMGMEFLAYPWVKDFFAQDVDKYQFLHLSQSLNFLLYGALVDHFQHEVYQNPQMTPAQRKECWRNLEKKYLLLETYEGDPFLEKGTFWFRQSHIFSTPFYYIDYTLAQVCALEIWLLSKQDYSNTWQKYLKLCQLGGSQTFLNLLKTTGLTNPFEPNHLKNIVSFVTCYLQKIDDTKF
ncbi:M3 family oligoendopeptidase [Rice orange leaf phytoplasma]|uniref:M3 family oligoendopeptidase n=1 Tax=Rice orange leaf phytoplasma TaxID=146897 RepID=UPI0008F5B611|nr:M3 family oligoendopeptidase [Rice orange leaf phytoplasma]OIJ44789.1 M3 family oligoendopeptidase [Rice orange leaf phytoplasma]